ncbi:hypothetical protein HPB52_024645 [Rhipicephalus sanguineus]|uniref:HTH CENPB-type domain-containing protein n=1 Tax=Rhipicephalus sanguineus TaxID=34632 RepID=A0A9D4YRY0_RHISA|nr:hypothetical protein HPB52_024645 [Rhipicephalus sanguineus]
MAVPTQHGAGLRARASDGNVEHCSTSPSTGFSGENVSEILSPDGNRCRDGKRLRLGNYQTVDDAILTWFKDARQHSVPLSGPIQKKARQLAVALGTSGFDVGARWLYRFRQKNGITWQVACGEEKVVDAKTAIAWRNGRFQEIIKSFNCKPMPRDCDDEAELNPELWNELIEKLPVDTAVTFEDHMDSDCAAATSAKLTCKEIMSQVREQECCSSDEDNTGEAATGTTKETISSLDVLVFLEKRT